MTQQFTASEVRNWERAYKGTGAAKVFGAFADLLEAREIARNDAIEREYERENNPAPSDAERLAEALERTARHRAAADRIDPDQWRSVLYSWEDRALASHSAQAQPPAARVTDAMVNAAMRADFCGHNVADALMYGTDWNTEVMRAALEAALAAQENPNG